MMKTGSRYFDLHLLLDASTVPLLRIAVSGALKGFGIEEEDADEAGETFTRLIADSMPDETREDLHLRVDYGGDSAEFILTCGTAVEYSTLPVQLKKTNIWEVLIAGSASMKSGGKLHMTLHNSSTDQK